MEMPSVTHPTTFKINGMYFKVVSYSKLSSAQAGTIVQNFYRTNKFKKKDQGKTFTVITTFDENSSGLL